MDECAPVDFSNSHKPPDLLDSGLFVIMKDLRGRGHVALTIHHDGSGSAAIYYKAPTGVSPRLRGTVSFQPEQFLFLRNCLIASDRELMVLLADLVADTDIPADLADNARALIARLALPARAEEGA